MSNAQDNSRLKWIRGELNDSLGAARHALDDYFEGIGDSASLIGECIQRLHQVHGTLQMVQLYGAALLAEEMELVAIAMRDGEVRRRDDAAEALMLGLIQLPDYLEKLESGVADAPILVLPMLNELRATRDAALLSEVAMFAPGLDARLAAESVTGEPNPRMQAISRGLRHQYHKALLDWYRETDAEGGLMRLGEIFGQLASHAGTAQVRRLFEVSRAVVAALGEGSLQPGIATKLLLGKVDREIKRLIEQGEAALAQTPANDLFKNLLYYTACAKSENPLIVEIKSEFDLSDGLPDHADVDGAREDLQAPGEELRASLHSAISADLIALKDGFDLYIRSQSGDPEHLQSLEQAMRKIADTLGMVGQGGLRQRLKQQADGLSEILANGRIPQESDLMGVAGDILYIETTLENMAASRPQINEGRGGADLPEGEFERLVEAVVHEARVEMARSKEMLVGFISSPASVDKLSGVPARFRLVAGALRMLRLDQPAEILDKLRGFVEQRLIHEQYEPEKDELNAFADAVTSLEYFMEAITEGRGIQQDILDIASQSLAALGLALETEDSAPERAVDDQSDDLVAGNESAAPSDQPDAPASVPEPAEPSEGALDSAPLPPTRQPGAAVQRPLLEEIDDEILEIFLEESHEELAVIQEYLPRWLADQHDREALTTFRRSFHTLKGSGRLVGASTIGEFAWSIENLLNRVIEGAVEASPDVQSLLEETLVVLPELIECQASGGVPTADIEGMMARAFAMADSASSAVVAEGRQATAKPEPEVETPASGDTSEGAGEARVITAPSVDDSHPVDAAEAEVVGEDRSQRETLDDQPEDLPGQPVAPDPGAGQPPILMDETLFTIFSNESATHIATLRQFVGDCVKNPPACRINEALTRALHTLHGSARMAEVESIAEVSARLESCINALHEYGYPVTAEILSLINNSADLFEAVLAVINVAGATPPVWRELAEQIADCHAQLEGMFDQASSSAAEEEKEGGGAGELAAEMTDDALPAAEKDALEGEPGGSWAQAEGDEGHSAIVIDGLPESPEISALESAAAVDESTLRDLPDMELVDGEAVELDEIELLQLPADALDSQDDGMESAGLLAPGRDGPIEPGAPQPGGSDADRLPGFDSDDLLAGGETVTEANAVTDGSVSTDLPDEEQVDAGGVELDEIELLPLSVDAVDEQDDGLESAGLLESGDDTAVATHWAPLEGREPEAPESEERDADRQFEFGTDDFLAGSEGAQDAAVEASAPAFDGAPGLPGDPATAETAESALIDLPDGERVDDEGVALNEIELLTLPGDAVDQLDDGLERAGLSAPGDEAAQDMAAPTHWAPLEESEPGAPESEVSDADLAPDFDPGDSLASVIEDPLALADVAELDAGERAAPGVEDPVRETDLTSTVELPALDDSVFDVQQLAADALVDTPAVDRAETADHSAADEAEDPLSSAEGETAVDTSGCAGPLHSPEIEDTPDRDQTADGADQPPSAATSADESWDYQEIDADPELLEIFLEEARELIEATERALSAWQETPASSEPVASLERSLHTLKGGARLSGAMPVGDLSHAFESLLTAVNHDRIEVTPDVLTLSQLVVDRLANQIDQLERGSRIILADDLIAKLEAAQSGKDFVAQPPPGETRLSAEPEEVAEVVAPPVSEQEAPGTDAIEAVADSDPDEAPQPTEAAPAEGKPPAPQTPRGRRTKIRVQSDLLDRLVNNAGEVSIYRARLEQQNGDLRFSISELEQTVSRLHDQLRQMEIETEAQILFRYEREKEEEQALDEAFDPLEFDRFSTMQQLSRSLIETVDDLVNICSELDEQQREAETLLLQQSRLANDLQDGLMRTRMVPFSQLVPRLQRVVRQTCNPLGKQAVLEVKGGHAELDRSILDRMTAPFEHLLRNAVSHGIESPQERRASGKNETGVIVIELQREGHDVLITVSDDGSGLPVEKIRRRAIEYGLLAPGADVPDNDVLQLVLEHGFSTAKEVTQISGRGVGLDIVVSEVKQLGGTLDIKSEPGQGTQFIIRLPLTLAISDAMLVTLGDEVYAIPHTSIEGVVRAAYQELKACFEGDQAYYTYAGNDYRVRYLGSLLNISQLNLSEQRKWYPMLLVRAGEHRFALLIDDVIGNRQIVVKSVGPQLSSVRWISGGTILGDGRVAIILDVTALVRLNVAQTPAAPAVAVEPEREIDHGKSVMVVDDSITVRKVTTRLLERHGMQVQTAKDGVDAISKLQEQRPDIMLLDIEMPRMDGFELARHMRNSDELNGIPIIMITSRTGDKHRNMALDLGVRRYLGKPYQESDLLDNIQSVLAEVDI